MRIVEAFIACYLHTDEGRLLIFFRLTSQFHFCHHQTVIITVEFIYFEGMVSTPDKIAALIDDSPLTELLEKNKRLMRSINGN